MVFRQQNPAARTQMSPEIARGGNRGRWFYRGAALALSVLLLGANVAPATCAATAARWLGGAASGSPGIAAVARFARREPRGTPCRTTQRGAAARPGGLAASPGTPGAGSGAARGYGPGRGLGVAGSGS